MNKIDILNIAYSIWLTIALLSLFVVGLPYDMTPPATITDLPQFLGSWWHIYLLSTIGLVIPKSKKIKLGIIAWAVTLFSLITVLISGVRFVGTEEEFVKTTGYLLIYSSVFGIAATSIQVYMKIKESNGHHVF